MAQKGVKKLTVFGKRAFNNPFIGLFSHLFVNRNFWSGSVYKACPNFFHLPQRNVGAFSSITIGTYNRLCIILHFLMH